MLYRGGDFEAGDRLAASDVNELARAVDQAASITSLPDMAVSRMHRGTAITSLARNDHEVLADGQTAKTFVGQIVKNGPNGTDDADFEDSRYWVREVFPLRSQEFNDRPTFEKMEPDPELEINYPARWIVATNIAEFNFLAAADDTHTLGLTDSDDDSAGVIVHVFSAFTERHGLVYFFNRSGGAVGTERFGVIVQIDAPDANYVWVQFVRATEEDPTLVEFLEGAEMQQIFCWPPLSAIKYQPFLWPGTGQFPEALDRSVNVLPVVRHGDEWYIKQRFMWDSDIDELQSGDFDLSDCVPIRRIR